MYGTIEEKKTRLLTDADRMRKTAAQINRVKTVVKQFDGKMYNCKLDNALKELSNEDGRVYAYNSCDWYYIQFVPAGRAYSDDYYLFSGRSAAACQNVDRGNNNFKTWEKNYCFTENKRVDFSKFCVLLNERYETLLKNAAAFEKAAADAEKILDQVATLKKQINAIVNTIPYTAQDILGLVK